ncbi:MAG TPA: hypothetical protein VMV56_03265 [Williamwhitmania sp.]|nr:hypothetical protein [Williamwhitmania sp.]
MGRWKIVLIVVVLVIIGGIAAGVYMYNKPHKNIANMTPEYVVNAKDIVSEFAKNEANASSKYIGRIVEVSGLVVDKTADVGGSITFSLNDPMSGVSCTVDSADVSSNKPLLDKIAVGDSAVFRGRCDGMLTDIQLSRCVPIK